MNLSHLLRSLLLLGLAFGQTELLAGNFRVSPVQIFLGDGGGSALITIFNEGDQPVRFQISATAWSQAETGEMRLEETEDILFFPKLLEIAPGAQRNVRVASKATAGEAEKTYRLFFDELPAAPVAGQGATVNVVTKMGVPIFITPRGAEPRVATGASVAGGTIHVNVFNRGSSHATLQEVRIRGLSADGTEVVSDRKSGWYLLANSARRYEFPLDERCRTLAKVLIDAAYTTPGTVEPLTSSAVIELPEGACDR